MPKAKRKAVAKSETPAKSNPPPAASSKPAESKAGSHPIFFCDADTSSESGFLSPWWPSPFELKGTKYLNAMQYILAEKARRFDDKETLQKILDAEGIADLKDLDRQIANVNDKLWRRCAPYIAKKANTLKFSASSALRADLQALGDDFVFREPVFADASDAFLGIGFGEDEAGEVGRTKWGANTFGKAVEAARKAMSVGPRDWEEFDRLVGW